MKYVAGIFIFIGVSVSLFSTGSSEPKQEPIKEINENQEVSVNQFGFEYDTFAISGKNLTISFIGHGTLMLEYNNKIIHVDPVSAEADYSLLPKADLILITHSHGDHLEGNAISKIKKENTVVIGTEECMSVVKELDVVKNGEKRDYLGISITAVPAYNTTNGRDKYHPKGRDNGYILDFNGKRVYIAGDTEDTPEMLALKGIDIAFLPMNQPYTMVPEQVALAARTIRPEVLYPYHFGNTDTDILVNLLKDEPDIEVRIRKLD